MTRIISLLLLAAGISIFAAGCSEENTPASTTIVTPEVSNYVDISVLPIEVGEYSPNTYTFRIANPFDNSSYEPADNASASVVLTYNGQTVANIMNLDKDSTSGTTFNTDLIILSTTCGNSTTYGAVPTVLAKGESCEFTYKIAPKAAFMFINKLAVEYRKQGFFGAYSDSTVGTAISPILNDEALIAKAKANDAYQLNETILKYSGKRSEYAFNGTVYREASQGTEVNHVFSKINGNLIGDLTGAQVVTETFDGGTNGATHTVTFLDLDNGFTGTASEASGQNMLLNAKMNANTSLLTFYTFNFDSSNNGCYADMTQMATNGTLTVKCNGGGQGSLSIGLKIGDDEYYKAKYLKSDKAYYVTSNYTTTTTKPTLNAYLWLERNDLTIGSGSVGTNNIDLNVKCWTSLNASGTAPSGSAIQLSNMQLNIFQKYDNTYNTDGTVNSTVTDYVLVKGECGGIPIDTEYPLSSFTHLSTDSTPSANTDGLQVYSPVSTNTLDGVVRHNLLAR